MRHMSYNVIRPTEDGQTLTSPAVLDRIRADLARDGWALLRGFAPGMEGFSALTAALCSKITFDPARDHEDDRTQKVDAGTGPIGLHVENGNTPVCPELVAFYSPVAAVEGSQTTICDGRAVLDAMDDDTRARWSQPMIVERYLPGSPRITTS